MPSVEPASPPNRPPTSSVPGIRASKLHDVFDRALSRTIHKGCSYPHFSACFPTPASYVPEALEGFHRDFVTKLEHACRTDYERLMEQRDVVARLNELDTLIDEARTRKAQVGEAGTEQGLSAHTMTPEKLMGAHLAPFLQEQENLLREQLQVTQDDNRRLADDIHVQRREIERLMGDLEKVVLNVEGAQSVFERDNIRMVEEELTESANSKIS